MKKDKTDKAAPAVKKKSTGRRVLKGLLTFIAVLLIIGILVMGAWAMPASYKSEIKGYTAIDGACAATKTMYTDDAGRLNFVRDSSREFKVMQITDVHMGCSPFTKQKDLEAMNAIHALADDVKPDLIICTGDCIYSAIWNYGFFKGSLFNKLSMETFASFMDTLGIPWTVAFGNHESEKYAFSSRKTIGGVLASGNYKNCVFTMGPSDIFGVSNQAIVVREDDAAKTVDQVLMVVDSNDYTDYNSSYDVIHQDQIDWYEQQITEIAAQQGKDPSQISSLAYFHIPVTEYRTAWDESSGNVIFGEKNEPTCCPANKDNDVFFAQMKAFGSCKAMFCGHDHTNNYSIEYQGIRLTYGLSIDYNAYKDIDKTDRYRGATVVSIDNNGFTIAQRHYADVAAN